MDPMLHLTAACITFIVLHALPSSPLRALLVRAIGQGPYLGLFSLVSLGGITWMVVAYNAAPVTPLWSGLRFLPAAVMPFALILLVCGVASRNPTSVGQGRLLSGDDAARGIIRVTRHPVMWALMLWAGAHILARGELKSTLFFGTFLLLAAAGTVLQDARKAQAYGAQWTRFAESTSNVPFRAIAAGRNRFVFKEIGLARILGALIVFTVVFHFHTWLFGARPY